MGAGDADFFTLHYCLFSERKLKRLTGEALCKSLNQSHSRICKFIIFINVFFFKTVLRKSRLKHPPSVFLASQVSVSHVKAFIAGFIVSLEQRFITLLSLGASVQACGLVLN